MRAVRLAVAGALTLAGALPALAAEPVVSVRYRGSPAGVPKLDDLAAIRAIGFANVTWPARETAGIQELRRMAELVGLGVMVRPERQTGTVSATANPDPDPVLELPVTGPTPDSLTAAVWRAVARGTRVIIFDPGQREGTGLSTNGQAAQWVAPAVAVARQLSANAMLVDRLAPGPPVTLDPPASLVDVVLLDADRSWVIVATNFSRDRQKAVARLPAGVPYALWLSWLDGSTMSMLSQSAAGPRWTFEIDAGSALIYIIDKKQREILVDKTQEVLGDKDAEVLGDKT